MDPDCDLVQRLRLRLLGVRAARPAILAMPLDHASAINPAISGSSQVKLYWIKPSAEEGFST
jgi:hypothetical protein